MNALAWQVFKRTVGLPLVLTLDNGRSYFAHPKAGNSAGAIYSRIYEAEYILFLRENICRDPGAVLLDVGAHTGLVSLLLADAFERAACFEPAPDTFRILETNLLLNRLSTFEPVAYAVSDKDGSGHLCVTGDFSGENRIQPVSGTNTIPVRTTTIDGYCRERDLMDKVRLLKVDTEGHELQVLRGARETLRQSSRALLMWENGDFQAVVSFLRGEGWRVFSVDRVGHPVLDEHMLLSSYNLLACREDHPLFDRLG
jgi:FkbM family methyltransferase